MNLPPIGSDTILCPNPHGNNSTNSQISLGTTNKNQIFNKLVCTINIFVRYLSIISKDIFNKRKKKS